MDTSPARSSNISPMTSQVIGSKKLIARSYAKKSPWSKGDSIQVVYFCMHQLSSCNYRIIKYRSNYKPWGKLIWLLMQMQPIHIVVPIKQDLCFLSKNVWFSNHVGNIKSTKKCLTLQHMTENESVFMSNDLSFGPLESFDLSWRMLDFVRLWDDSGGITTVLCSGSICGRCSFHYQLSQNFSGKGQTVRPQIGTWGVWFLACALQNEIFPLT